MNNMAQRLSVLYNKKPCYDIVFQQSFDGLWEELAELGAANVTDEQLMEVAKAASAEGDTLQNMPFTVTPESVFAAIKAADAYGRYYLGEE